MLRARAVAARRRSAALAARTLSTDGWSSATVCGVGNQAATLVATPALLPGDVPQPKRFSFTVDLPSEEGGRGTAASPPQHLIGALVGCLQAALHTTAAEGQVSLGTVRWAAEGKYRQQVAAPAAQGQGGAPSLASVSTTAQVDTAAPQAVLDELREAVLHRSLLAATLQAAGVQLRLDLKKHYTFKSSMGTYIDDMVHKAKSIDHF